MQFYIYTGKKGTYLICLIHTLHFSYLLILPTHITYSLTQCILESVEVKYKVWTPWYFFEFVFHFRRPHLSADKMACILHAGNTFKGDIFFNIIFCSNRQPYFNTWNVVTMKTTILRVNIKWMVYSGCHRKSSYLPT